MTFTGAATPSPVFLDTGLTLSTDNIDPIASATVQISSAGFLSGDTLSFGAVTGATVGASSTSGGVVSETLSFADGDTIGASFNTATGLLTLTTVTTASTTTATDYQAALRFIEFSHAGDPTNGGSDKTRSLTWTVVDENQNANNPAGPAGNGNTATGTSGVTLVLTGPSVTAGALVTFTENQAPIPLDTGLALSDANVIKSATVSIGSFISGEDLLTLSASFNTASGVLTLTALGGSASFTDFQTALEHVRFVNPGDPTGGGTDPTRTLTWTVVDTNQTAINTGSSTSTINGAQAAGGDGRRECDLHGG